MSRGGFDIAVTEEDYSGNEDRRWLGARLGTDVNRSITLDASTFVAAHLTSKGAVPSGTLLGKITATGKYGPYGGAGNEVQSVAVDATSGTFTLAFEGDTTAAIAFNATAAAVKAALEALPGIDIGDVSVTGGPGAAGGATPYVVTFSGQYAGENVATLVAADVDLAGGGDSVVVSTTTAGGSAVSDGREVASGHLFSTTKLGNGTGADLATAADVGAALFWHGIVKESFLPVFSGTVAGEIDAAAREVLSNHIRYEA